MAQHGGEEKAARSGPALSGCSNQLCSSPARQLNCWIRLPTRQQKLTWCVLGLRQTMPRSSRLDRIVTTNTWSRKMLHRLAKHDEGVWVEELRHKLARRVPQGSTPHSNSPLSRSISIGCSKSYSMSFELPCIISGRFVVASATHMCVHTHTHTHTHTRNTLVPIISLILLYVTTCSVLLLTHSIYTSCSCDIMNTRVYGQNLSCWICNGAPLPYSVIITV